MSDNTMQVASQGEQEIVIRRDFAAPPALVWRAWTTPALLQQWLGVMPGWEWEWAVCEIDLRVGGAYRYVWRKGSEEMGLGGVFREVTPVTRLAATEQFDTPWYPGEGQTTLELAERDGGRGTAMTFTLRYESAAARDDVLASDANSGMAIGFDNLDRVLADQMAIA